MWAEVNEQKMPILLERNNITPLLGRDWLKEFKLRIANPGHIQKQQELLNQISEKNHKWSNKRTTNIENDLHFASGQMTLLE